MDRTSSLLCFSPQYLRMAISEAWDVATNAQIFAKNGEWEKWRWIILILRGKQMKIDMYVLLNGGCVRCFRTVERQNASGEDFLHLRELDIGESGWDGEEQMTDRAGRFEKGDRAGIKGGLAGGERHSQLKEEKLRRGEAIAEVVGDRLLREEARKWVMIAPPVWANLVIHHLGPEMVDRLENTIDGDWTGMEVAEIENMIFGNQ